MFLYRAKKVHGDKYDYSKVTRSVGARVIISCLEHGEFERLTREFLAGRGCLQCQEAERRRGRLEEFVREARKVHGDKYDYDRVGIAYPKMTITCKEHGDFKQSRYHHLRGSGCPICKPPFNRPASLVARWLDSLGLPNDPQHRNVGDLIPGLNVAGFDPETNTVYEFYGDLYHGNLKIYPPEVISSIAGKSFGQLNLARLEREHVIRSAGFELVTVWESDFKVGNESGLPTEISDYLDTFIQENNLNTWGLK